LGQGFPRLTRISGWTRGAGGWVVRIGMRPGYHRTQAQEEPALTLVIAGSRTTLDAAGVGDWKQDP